jgi:NADH-quinone oxidoreductase subunit L
LTVTLPDQSRAWPPIVTPVNRITEHTAGHGAEAHGHSQEPHESPRVMTVPLIILAGCSILLGFLGTPAWPWFQKFLGHEAEAGFSSGVITLMIVSTLVVAVGIGLGWLLYGRKPITNPEAPDALEKILQPEVYALLQRKYFFDEVYERSVIRLHAKWATLCDGLEFWAWNGIVQAAVAVITALSWVSKAFDEYVVNLGFDAACQRVRRGGKVMSRLQNGRVQSYLRAIGIALVALVLWLMWRDGK